MNPLPKLLEALQLVMPSGQEMSRTEIFKALGTRGWLPNSDDPLATISACLQDHPQIFICTWLGPKSHSRYRIREAQDALLAEAAYAQLDEVPLTSQQVVDRLKNSGVPLPYADPAGVIRHMLRYIGPRVKVTGQRPYRFHKLAV